MTNRDSYDVVVVGAGAAGAAAAAAAAGKGVSVALVESTRRLGGAVTAAMHITFPAVAGFAASAFNGNPQVVQATVKGWQNRAQAAFWAALPRCFVSEWIPLSVPEARRLVWWLVGGCRPWRAEPILRWSGGRRHHLAVVRTGHHRRQRRRGRSTFLGRRVPSAPDRLGIEPTLL